MSDKILKLFEGQSLSEEFKTQVVQIFTEAVEESASTKVEQLKESIETELKSVYEAKTEAKLAELEDLTEQYIQEEVVPHVDKYLTTAVNEWAEENKVAIEAGAKVQLAESFLQGLVGLAESHNLDMPQADRVSELEASIAQLKESVNKLAEEKVELVTENTRLVKERIIAEQTLVLTDVQKEKIAEAVSKLTFNGDVDAYAENVKSLVESTFPTAPTDVQPIVEQTQEQTKPLTLNEQYFTELFKKVRSS